MTPFAFKGSKKSRMDFFRPYQIRQNKRCEMSGNGKSRMKKGNKKSSGKVIDINTHMNRTSEEEKLSDMSAAQNLISDAWESQSSKKRLELANKALKLWRDCADAYMILAEDKARSIEESVKYYEEGVQAGERALGKDGFEAYEGHFWGVLETRPYMRARAGLAVILIQLGEKEKAAQHYREMLILNPSDNQGIRYELVALNSELGNDKELEDFVSEHEGDPTAPYTYTRALVAFREEGDSPRSRGDLAEAIKNNPYVPGYLLERKKLPRLLPEYTGIGDVAEAVYFAFTFGLGWAMTKGALDWLRQVDRDFTEGGRSAGENNRKIGRNEPCPCGSGKKYKRCCGGIGAVEQGATPADGTIRELEEFLEGQPIESLEQFQAETDRFMDARNLASMKDFDGLSADQMTWLLYRAFDQDSPVVFKTETTVPAEIPFLKLFMSLIKELGGGPLKETVTGNLPRKTVRAVAQSYFDASYTKNKRFMTGIRGENDFMPFHVVRLNAGMGGFIKKKYQRFSLTKRGESVLLNGVSGEVFLRLLEIYFRKYNWAYWDGFPELQIVQISAFYTLYLLQKYGDEDRPQSFYADKFMAAFPMAVNEFEEGGYATPEERVHSCFTWRAMGRFAHFFGFTEYVGEDTTRSFMEERVVRKTPFLDDLISFRLDKGQT